MAGKKPLVLTNGSIKEIGAGDTVPISNGGTGATTATAALNALLPSQTGNNTKVLGTDGTNTSWVAVSGANLTGTIPSAVLGNSALFVGTTSIALNRASGNQALTGILSTTFAGSTSGTTVLIPTAIAGTTTITLPAVTGTIITTGDSGTVTNTMLAGSIANAKLSNSTISGISLGSNLATLTIGTGLSGTSYNGSGAITVAIDSTVVTLTGTQTLNNKTLGDAVNTVSTPTTTSVGYLGIPQNSRSTAYTLVLTDAGKHLLHPSADTTARTFTIPANSSVAFPIGTAVTFINQNGGGVITIAITTDTMRLAGAGTTGSRTLAANGIATAIKVTSTEWIINGVGLT